jgi:hypothetical protein
MLDLNYNTLKEDLLEDDFFSILTEEEIDELLNELEEGEM